MSSPAARWVPVCGIRVHHGVIEVRARWLLGSVRLVAGAKPRPTVVRRLPCARDVVTASLQALVVAADVVCLEAGEAAVDGSPSVDPNLAELRYCTDVARRALPREGGHGA